MTDPEPIIWPFKKKGSKQPRAGWNAELIELHDHWDSQLEKVGGDPHSEAGWSALALRLSVSASVSILDLYTKVAFADLKLLGDDGPFDLPDASAEDSGIGLTDPNPLPKFATCMGMNDRVIAALRVAVWSQFLSLLKDNKCEQYEQHKKEAISLFKTKAQAEKDLLAIPEPLDMEDSDYTLRLVLQSNASVLSVACRRKVQAENFFITDSAQVWLKAMGSAVASLNARVADFNR